MSVLLTYKRLFSKSIFSFPNFCESLVFIDSNYSCGIQCADFCAGAIHKKFESDDDSFFNLLLPAIRCNKNNNIYGYGIKLYK